MTDWYVDSSATGNNSGTSAGDAAIDINSLTVGGTVAFGDRVWVRRTMHWQINSFICGRSGFNAGSNNPLEIIGWPSSGDPHFLERPAGAAAVWDADAALYTGMPWPVLVTSGTGNQANPTIRIGQRFTNWLFTGSTALVELNTMTQNIFGLKTGYTHWGKVGFLNFKPDGGGTFGYLDEIIYCMSGVAQTNGIENVGARRLTITASCIGIPIQTDYLYFNEVVIESNSVSQIAVILSQNWPGVLSYVGKVNGIKPKGREFATQLNSDSRFPVIVDNWFGEGPRQFSPQIAGPNASIPTSGTALHSGANATWIWGNSAAAASTNDGGLISDLHNVVEHVGQHMSVASGTPITVTLNFFHAGGVGSLDGNRGGWMQLSGRGGSVQKVSGQHGSGGLYAGNPSDWGGNSAAVGSAYVMRHRWTPTETGTMYLSARVPLPIQFAYVTSASIFVAPFFAVTTG